MNLRQTTATTVSRLHRSIHYVFRTITPSRQFLLIMTTARADVLSMAIEVAVQFIHYKGIRPDTAHLEEQTFALMNPFRGLRVRSEKRADIRGILVLGVCSDLLAPSCVSIG